MAALYSRNNVVCKLVLEPFGVEPPMEEGDAAGALS